MLGAGHSSTHASSAKTITLEGPSSTPAALYVQELLALAYGNLGYRIEYEAIPLARSFVEANNGRIDGLRARVGTVADKYPNLVRVPFHLLDFEVMLIGDRRVCGVCDLRQTDELVMPRGFKAIGDILGEYQNKFRIVEVPGDKRALDMLSTGKVKLAAVSDVNVPEAFFQLNHHWVKQTLARLPDYHYLHKKHADLVSKVSDELHRLDAAGEVDRLRKKYNLVLREPPFDMTQVPAITAVSGDWIEFTDTEDATYWHILRSVFETDTTEFQHQISNWKRAKQIFEVGQADILVGAYDFEVKPGMLRSDLHIDYELPVMAYSADRGMLEKQLAGKEPATACYEIGYDFKQWLPDNITPYEGTSPRDCARLLRAERVDMVVEYAPDIDADIRENYHARQITEGHPLFVAFHNTPKGRALKKRFEHHFREMVVAGQVRDMFPDVAQYRRANLELARPVK